MRVLCVWVFVFLCLFLQGCGQSENRFVNQGGSIDASSGLPLPSTVSETQFEELLYAFLLERRYLGKAWTRDKRIRDTGPYLNGEYFGTHPAVRIYYSPEVITWLEAGRPQGELPNGAMIIKEMYEPPAARYADNQEIVPTQWTVMVRDTDGSHDGWFWTYFSSNPENSNPPVPQQPDSDDFPFNYPDSGFGVYCVRCHGSAAEDLTFVNTANIEGFPGEPLVYEVDDSWMTDTQPDPVPHPNDTNDIDVLPRAIKQALDEGDINQEFLDYFDQFPAQTKDQIEFLPPVTQDRVVAQSHLEFLTSDQCLSCHSGDTSPFGPNMVQDGVDISPWGEWRWSMMGLAGRDPIFFSQMETEIGVHALPGGDFSAEDIQNFCLRCHGVMGQREFNSDNPGENFTLDKVLTHNEDDPNKHYGSLARDGVSCMVCHQIQDQKDFPIPMIDTGKFVVDDRVDGLLEVFGQHDNLTVAPMIKALGVIPKNGDHLKDSLVCASCHLVNLPVLDENGQIEEFAYEQATFFEWQNSAFGIPGSDFQSCQDCHMPQTFHNSAALEFKVANIQDQDFPEADGVAELDQIRVEPRGDYSRHELSGINVFALEFFRHYPDILGVRTKSFMTGLDNGLNNSIQNSLETATRSANVEVLSSSLNAGVVESEVRVTNLTGHRFPSGVGFRRAFLEFVVKDGSGQIVWASGQTNDLGVILGANGQPLPSETHEDIGGGQQAFEPHHQVVDSEDEAQVYAELIRNAEGKFGTTFLGRNEEVKDNRLMPKGWTFAGPPGMDPEFVETTNPIGAARSDADFTDGTGSDTLTYRATLPPSATGPFTVEAKLFYQAIPPIYLKNRFEQASGPATRRLHYMASRLNTDQTSFPGWKLSVSETSRAVAP